MRRMRRCAHPAANPSLSSYAGVPGTGRARVAGGVRCVACAGVHTLLHTLDLAQVLAAFIYKCKKQMPHFALLYMSQCFGLLQLQ